MDHRKCLISREIEKLIATTNVAQHEARDRYLLMLMFRHGLRVSEALS
jgi:type 1 fimbriae regulatory protein FimB